MANLLRKAIMKKPIWSDWEHIPVVSLFEICALSLNIAPASLTRELVTTSKRDEIRIHGFVDDKTHEAFYKRCKVLYANLDIDRFFTLPSGVQNKHADSNIISIDARVSVSEFIRWAVMEVGWEIPEELKRLSKEKTKASPQPIKRSKMREQEELILKVLKDLGYDPLNLPKASGAISGAKYKVRNQLGSEHPFESMTSFDTTWERLRKDGCIKDSNFEK